jgi:hypothetical protein
MPLPTKEPQMSQPLATKEPGGTARARSAAERVGRRWRGSAAAGGPCRLAFDEKQRYQTGSAQPHLHIHEPPSWLMARLTPAARSSARPPTRQPTLR